MVRRYRGIAQMEPMDPSYESATEFVEKSWKNLCPKNRSLENPWWLWSGLVAMGSKICGMIASENGREISRVCWLQGEIHHEFHGLHFFHFFSRSIPHARRVQIPIFSNICWSNVRLFVLTCSFQVYFANTAAHVGSLTGLTDYRGWTLGLPRTGGLQNVKSNWEGDHIEMDFGVFWDTSIQKFPQSWGYPNSWMVYKKKSH